MAKWWKNSHQVIRVTENTHRWPSQAIGPAQTKAGDVGVSDMGWCLRRFRRVTLKALWCVQNDVKGCSDIKSSLHMLYPWVNSIYLLFITFHAVSGQNEEVMLCLVNQFYQALQQEPSFFTRLGNVATAASIIWIREGHDWSCWLVTWLLARDWISKLQVDHPRQQWSNDQEM